MNLFIIVGKVKSINDVTITVNIENKNMNVILTQKLKNQLENKIKIDDIVSIKGRIIPTEAYCSLEAENVTLLKKIN